MTLIRLPTLVLTSVLVLTGAIGCGAAGPRGHRVVNVAEAGDAHAPARDRVATPRSEPAYLRSVFCGQPLADLINKAELFCLKTTPAEIQSLHWLPRLRSLSIHGDLESFEPFRGLTGLRKLHVVGAAGTLNLGPLVSLTNLQSLTLFMVPIEDLSPLAKMPGLTSLSIACLGVLPDLGPLGKLPELVELGVTSGPFGDGELGQLPALNKLRKLDLTGTEVTDAGLWQLHRFTRLLELTLIETGVTDAGVLALRQAMPNLVVER